MMVLVDFPSIVKKYGVHFESCFSSKGYEHFMKAVSGFLVSDNKTLEGINRLFVQSVRNQSSFNRFFNRHGFDINQVNAARLTMLQQFEGTCFKGGKKGGGVLAVDDTLLKHKGKHFDHIYRLKDYVNDCYRYAHDLVTLYYSDDQTDYPVDYQLWLPPDWEAVAQFFMERDFKINPQKWANRKEEPGKWRSYIRDRFKGGCTKFPEVKQIYQTKNHIAEALIHKFCEQYSQWDFPIALDCGFTSAKLCQYIDKELGRAYVGSLRAEQRLVVAGNKEISLEDFLTRLREEHFAPDSKPVFKKVCFSFKGKQFTRYAYVANHRIKSFKHKQRLVISFSKEDLSSRPIFSISNRLDWYPSGILRIHRHRWPVETYHQEGKAEGLEKYQVRNFKAIQSYITFIVVAYSMLKCAIHDQDLLSSIQQRLQTETDGTLPYLRRLFQAEGLLLLIEFLMINLQEGKTIGQVIQKVTAAITYS